MAPAAVLLVLSLAVTDAPLQARWLSSRPSFDAVVQDIRADPGFDWPESRRVGSYTVTDVTIQLAWLRR